MEHPSEHGDEETPPETLFDIEVEFVQESADGEDWQDYDGLGEMYYWP